MVIILIVTAVAHYLNGGIRLQVQGQRVTPQVKAHLSVLLALLAILRAVGYWLQRYSLLTSDRGFVDGATYTAVKAELPAINLLFLISILAAVLLVVNIWQRGWRLPIIAVGLWGLVAVVAGTIYPAFVQRFIVQPAESEREKPYITRNIEATRAALGLDKVQTEPYKVDSLDVTELPANADNLRNVRLLDPEVVPDTYKRLQGLRGYYQFNDLDVDRYSINGKDQQVVLAARELNPSDLPIDTWEGRHLAYTHGYGIAMAPASQILTDGKPDVHAADRPECRARRQAAVDLLRREPARLRRRRHQARRDLVRPGTRHRGAHAVPGRRWRADGFVPPAGRVRAAVRRVEPHGVEPHHQGLADPVRPRRRRPREAARPVPHLRQRPLSRHHLRRAGQVDRRRLHEHRSLSLRGDGRHVAAPDHLGPAEAVQLRAQLDQGGRGRLRRRRHVLRGRSQRSLGEVVPEGLSVVVHPGRGRPSRSRRSLPVSGGSVPGPDAGVLPLPHHRPVAVLPAGQRVERGPEPAQDPVGHADRDGHERGRPGDPDA